jgi:hypothetical protein
VGFVVDKVALGKVFLRVLRFFLVNFIPPVLHYTEKRKKLIFITGLHNKPQGYGASVASAAGPFTPKKVIFTRILKRLLRGTDFRIFSEGDYIIRIPSISIKIFHLPVILAFGAILLDILRASENISQKIVR